MFNQSPSELIAGIITLMIAFTAHEFAHAWSATQFGDDTPSRFGRLTLNPLKHLDVMGSIMLLLTGFGWAKPVTVDENKISRHSPAAMMLVAISGPISNFLMALLAAIPLRFNWVNNVPPLFSFMPSGYQFLIFFLFTNLGLMLFNLIPLPPLDGEEVLVFLLPPKLQKNWETFRSYGPYILIFLLVIGPMIGFNLIDAVLRPAIISIGKFLLGGW